MTYYHGRASPTQKIALRLYMADPWSEAVDLKMHETLVRKGLIEAGRPTRLTELGKKQIES